jgi:predicted Zn-dependent protease
MKTKIHIQILTLCLAMSQTLYCWADINIKLNAPTWEFLLKNEPQSATEAQLAPSENNFARSIQPLLSAQNHSAISQAFEKRDINNDSAALRLLRGQIMLSLKQYNKAEQALKAALDSMPNLAAAHRSLSMVYMIEKHYAQARQHLTRSIELGVADAQTYGQLAFVNLQLGQAASAIAGYQYALFMEADNKQWQIGLLYALIQSQAFNQAQALLEDLLKNDPKNAELWLQRGQLALRQERPQQSIASLENALQLGVKDAENIATIAQLHIQSGSPRRAIELLGGAGQSKS